MKPRRFWTFSLRTLLLGSTLAAIGLAFLGNRMIENRRQERLLDEVLNDVKYNMFRSVGFSDGKDRTRNNFPECFGMLFGGERRGWGQAGGSWRALR